VEHHRHYVATIISDGDSTAVAIASTAGTYRGDQTH
jgi:hypothetical protein